MRTFLIAAAAAALSTAAAAQTIDLGDPKTEIAGAMATSLFVRADGPVTVAAAARPGGMIATTPARHARAGLLTDEVTGMRAPGQPAQLAAGTPIYAVALGSSQGPQRVWCSPTREGAAPDEQRQATCIVGIGGGKVRLADGFGKLLVTRVEFRGARTGDDAPGIDERPVDFGVPMAVGLRFQGWRGGRMDADLVFEAGPETTVIKEVTFERARDGSVLLEILDGLVRLTPDGDGAAVAVVRAPTPLPAG